MKQVISFATLLFLIGFLGWYALVRTGYFETYGATTLPRIACTQLLQLGNTIPAHNGRFGGILNAIG